MKKLPKPAKLKNFKAGIPYFEVSVTIDGSMMYLEEIFVPLGRIYSRGKNLGLCFNSRTNINGRKMADYSFIDDCGLILHKCDTLHRTFRYNGKDYEILKEMVKRQDLAAYKELIGIKKER
jgi:hypothetical protein